MQEYDAETYDPEKLVCVTERKPTEKEMEDLNFAWKVVKHTKSNAIVLAKDNMTTGVGRDRRTASCRPRLRLTMLASGRRALCLRRMRFSRFPDCVQEAAKAGVTAIIQPGGSVNDQLSIDECNKHGIAMVFCGMRHFKH